MSLNLNDFIMTNEMPIRLGFFFGIFAVMALWEMVSPRRRLRAWLCPPVVAVVVFEVVLNATAMFNHSNVRMPVTLDRLLRLVVVTPDMHRVHHSGEGHETNSNFGFNLPWWDRLFGTYRAQPRAGHEAMTIGIHTFREDKWCSWLPGMLTMPFIGKVQDYAINRRQWSSDHE